MYIFQKNFNTVTIPEIKSPWLRENVSLPIVNGSLPNNPGNSMNSEDSHRPDALNSSVNPELQNPLSRNPIQRIVANTRASETDEILANSAQTQNKSLLDKLIKEHDAKEISNAVITTKGGQDLAKVEEVPVIDSTVIDEEALPKRSIMEVAKTKATVAATNTKKGAKELAGKAKNAVIEGYNKLAENYGEGLTGSLGTDAALAAGGLALAGGAYHLLKKRRAKKKAEKEALENRIKK